ncbi:transmembrane channel-like protein 7 isoform X2 [Periplaneta americana]|uniref:transmembrane channel-like protein 7 isoform X2 n=1 Tax=Periplaneta americana TaxID=6978 RepID=UPI0037E968C6
MNSSSFVASQQISIILSSDCGFGLDQSPSALPGQYSVGISTGTITMSRSSGYSSRDDIHMEVFTTPEGRRWPGGRRPDSQSTTVERPHSSIMTPQHRHLNRGAAQYQFNPRCSNSSSSRRPSMSRTLSHRRHSVHARPVKRQVVINDLPSRNMGDALSTNEGSSHVPLLPPSGHNQSEDNHAAQIVSEMEKDTALMEDNPLSEQLRMETLRELPESLTMKRTIKRKLVKSVSLKSKHSPLSIWKQMKYRISISFSKFQVAVKNVLYTFELWYSGIKKIEGHFGSGVATYFRFLRWLFLLNSIVFLISFGFIVVPQLLHRFYEPVEGNQTQSVTVDIGFIELQEENNSTTRIVTPLPFTTENWKDAPGYKPRVRSKPYASNADFSFENIFTGEGFFTDTTLYYGYYTNETFSMVSGLQYNIPAAYFFTVLACYLFIFVTLSVSMARSYRKTFIETAGDLKNVFAHKVFCGWDFSTATNEAAVLKSKSIYNDLKELLEDLKKDEDELSCQSKFFLFLSRFLLNVFVTVLLGCTGLLMWFLLRGGIGTGSATALHHGATMVMPLIITVLMMVSPVLFSWLARHEDYSNPRTALFVTLTRTFLMEIVVIGVVVGFWLTYKNAECWETSLGQEIYRLVIIDFLLAVVGTSVAEFIRYRIYKSIWKKIGVPEFDIARNTLNLIYNQTLFFVGFYFSPLLAFIIILKMFITFYIKKLGVLQNCKPSGRPWRAAQTQTLFLVLSFIATLVVLILLGYIITQVEASSCGPFRTYTFPYELILDVFQLDEENDGFVQFIRFLIKPGVTAGILLAMCVGVYYLRATSNAHMSMVRLLREMLVLEAKDKEFLLSSISKVTEGQWIYNLKTDKTSEPDWMIKKQLHQRMDNYDSASSSGASGAGGEHNRQSSVSHSDLSDIEGLSQGDVSRSRGSHRDLYSPQHPSSTSDISLHPSEHSMSGFELPRVRGRRY